MAGIGHRVWALSGGHIPYPSNGAEPQFTSFDQLCLLNTGEQPAEVTLTIYYVDQEPVGPYQFTVAANRVRHIRFNDLIDPEAIRLDRPFGAVLRSPVPIVVQFLRQDTRIPGALGLTGGLAFPVTGASD
ncbi:MAG TPA: sensory rhodopsin transducer [Micromonosporaceae bacterium]|nr:sensory rhodopsin transducer [Micromonosporaceae bacterium]